MFTENTFTAGNNWVARAMEKSSKGLKRLNNLNLVKASEAILYFEFNADYDLALVDSSNHRHQAELWLCPKNSAFLAVLVYNVKHDRNYSEKSVNALARLIAMKAKKQIKLVIASGFENYVASKNVKTNGLPKVNFNSFNLTTVKSVRLRTEISRLLRESIKGKIKTNHWDKVSL